MKENTAVVTSAGFVVGIADLEGLTVQICSLEHLLEMKRATDRALDAADQALAAPVAGRAAVPGDAPLVGVGVAQPHHPRIPALTVQRRQLQGPQRGVDLSEIPACAGLDQRHLRLQRRREPFHTGALGKLQGTLRIAGGAMAVRHDRQIGRRSVHPLRRAQL
jgi:hypothetical protein